MAQANAVAARMELDLRVGAIFTRTQSLELQRRVDALGDMLISYGTSTIAPLTSSAETEPSIDSLQVPASSLR